MIKHVDKIAMLVLLVLLTAYGRQPVMDASLPAVESDTPSQNRVLNETITSFNFDDTDEIGEIGKNENSEILNWWGIYHNQENSLGITNFDGKMFIFQLSSMDGRELDGAAPVSKNDSRRAEYMDLLFQYNEMEDSITISMVEQREDSRERDRFTGIYKRVSETEWEGTYCSEDEQTMEVKRTGDRRLEITYRGYSEEGWYTDTFELEFCDTQQGQAMRPAVEGISEEEYYTLAEEGITVRTNPAGAWKDGFYERE